ncbi:MAG: glycosyltransferase family 25 protein [Hyphomicrobiales bacterium]|nr:MAG: glycosyltransferase family 25 protein [Hyphomicrobiales bacterium]
MPGIAEDAWLAHVPKMEIPYDGDARQALGFDLPSIVINLPHRTDRWDAISTRLGAVGLTKLTKAPAVLGADLSDAQLTALLGPRGPSIRETPRDHLSLTPPAVGCFLSHVAIWQWVVAHELPRVMVLEDDAHPGAHFDGARFARVVGSLTPEDNLVFPGCLIMGGLADRPSEGRDLARLYYFNGTFAYMITPAGCRFLLSHIKAPDRHVDHQISRVLMQQRRAFPAWYVAPPLLEPDWSLRSDCYVPLSHETDADRELGLLIDDSRAALLAEGRPLLPK